MRSTPVWKQLTLARYGFLALAVWLLALTGIYWRPLGQLSALWPVNAILLGLFLRVPVLASPAGWIAAATGFIAADLMTGTSWPVAIALSLTNLLSVFVALALCSKLSASQRRQIPPDALSRLFASMLAAACAAGMAGGLLRWQLVNANLWDAALRWGVSELLAYIILLPCVLSAPGLQDWRARERLSVFNWLVKKLAPACSLVLALLAGIFIGGPGLVAFPVSALMICALSCGLFETSVMTLAFSVWTLLGTTLGGIQPWFDIHDSNARLSLRLGVASIAVAPLVVASVMAARERNLRAMRYLAEHDALTGLLNRRSFHERAQAQLASLFEHHKSAAILILDIDYFKRINDTYGHAVGDEVLSRVARRLRQSLRNDDICGRIGGEEFAALIPDCTPGQVEAVTRRIHEAIKSERFEMPELQGEEPLGLSVSIGATLSRGFPDDLRTMLIRADHAMYAAKQAGRNQTCIV